MMKGVHRPRWDKTLISEIQKTTKRRFARLQIVPHSNLWVSDWDVDQAGYSPQVALKMGWRTTRGFAPRQVPSPILLGEEGWGKFNDHDWGLLNDR